jgi:hypothetical protein
MQQHGLHDVMRTKPGERCCKQGSIWRSIVRDDEKQYIHNNVDRARQGRTAAHARARHAYGSVATSRRPPGDLPAAGLKVRYKIAISRRPPGDFSKKRAKNAQNHVILAHFCGISRRRALLRVKSPGLAISLVATLAPRRITQFPEQSDG